MLKIMQDKNRKIRLGKELAEERSDGEDED